MISPIIFQIIIPSIWISAAIFSLPLLLSVYYNEQRNFCMEDWPQQWMGKANSMAWVVVTGAIPICLMAGLYSRVAHALWYQNVDDGDNAQQVRCVSNVCVSWCLW